MLGIGAFRTAATVGLAAAKKIRDATTTSTSGGNSSSSSPNKTTGTGTRTPTTIYDPNGGARTGYIQNGATYYDDGTRITSGSRVVDNSGREWKMGKTSGSLTGTNYGIDPTSTGGTYSGGSSRSSSSDYDNIVDAINAEKKKQTDLMLGNIRAAYDEQRADYSNQIPTVQQDASTMRNKIDTGYYQSLPELYRAMEAGGQRGGENITGMVGLNTTRMEGQNQANLYETNQVQNIRNALSGLDTSQIQAETQAQSGINSDAFANLMTAMRDSAAQTKTNLNTAKSDFENTIGAFSSDYQAEINRLTNLMSTGQTNDMDGISIAYKIAALNRERNQKIKDEEAAAYEASLDSESNALAWARLNKTGGSGANESPLEYDEAFILYQQGDRSPAVKRALGIQ